MTNEQISEKLAALSKSFEKGLEAIKEITSDFTYHKKGNQIQRKKYDAKSLMARLTSIQACCEEVGETYQDVLDRSGKSDDNVVYEEMKVVALAFRKGQAGKDWVPNYKDKNQERWFPIFNTSSGFSFGYASCGDGYSWSNAGVGGRLCFPTKELATFVGKTFLNKYAVLHGIEE